jgi:hypothetical protein
MKCYLEELSQEDRLASRRTSIMEEREVDESFTYGHRCSDRALDFLSKSNDEDFFLVVSYDEPHGPCVCPKPYSTMYKGYDYPKKKNVWDDLLLEIPELGKVATEHFNQWSETEDFAKQALTGEVEGIHGFYHENIFEAVYCTNLLMRSADVLVTKPSELAFYPIPKLFIKRVGKHEMWGAIHSAEIGDGTLECRDIPHTIQMIKLFLEDDRMLRDMCGNIMNNKTIGIYDGAYKVVELAMGLKK